MTAVLAIGMFLIATGCNLVAGSVASKTVGWRRAGAIMTLIEVAIIAACGLTLMGAEYMAGLVACAAIPRLDTWVDNPCGCDCGCTANMAPNAPRGSKCSACLSGVHKKKGQMAWEVRSRRRNRASRAGCGT